MMLALWVVAIIVVVLFFFFQAEDGIRDLTVTGVQTCALPISHDGRYDEIAQFRLIDGVDGNISRPRCGSNLFLSRRIVSRRDNEHHAVEIALRSEERRVGKSVDLGGVRSIKKKQK